MNAALLCPGPSLARVTADDLIGHPIIAGVNRAIHAFRCNWWIACDWHAVADHRPSYTPRLFTCDASLATLRRQGAWVDEYQPLTFESLHEHCPASLSWGTFSAPAGLVLLWHLGATRIDVFGADWAVNAPDWDAFNDPHNRRDANRWEHEGAIWGRVVEWLNERGVSVERIKR